MSTVQKQWDYIWRKEKDTVQNAIRLISKDHWYDYLKPLLLNRLKKYKKGLILESGCGIGQWVFYLFSKKYKVYGIDCSKIAIKNATEYQKSKKIPNNFILNDTRELSFNSDTFSFIFSFGTIEHFPNALDALNEFYRVLKPGGECFITTPNIFSTRFINSKIARILGRWSVGYEDLYSPNMLAKMMASAGFKEINYGIMPTGLSLDILIPSKFPILKNINILLRKLSIFLERKQSKFGFLSYSIGIK